MLRRDSIVVIVCYSVLWLLTAVPVLLSPLGDYPVVDAAWHNTWAGEIAHGNLFVYAPYFRAPLYPMVLGLLYFLTGSSMLSGVILSFVLGLFSVRLVHLTVFNKAGRIPSIAAASVWMLNGVNLFYSTTLLITPMYVCLLLLAFFLLDRKYPCLWGWLVLGLAAVTRPGAVLLFPVALFLYRKSWKHSWLMLIPVILVWSINWIHGDKSTIISSQGGINLYIGNGPSADGFTAFAPPGSGIPPDSLPYVDNVWSSSVSPFSGEVTPGSVSSWWVDRTVEHVVLHLREFLTLTGKKLLYLLSPVAIPSNYDVYYYCRYSPVLKILAGSPGFPVPGLLIWLLIPGALAAGRLKKREGNPVLWAVCLAVGVLPFFVTARFRLPIISFMIIFMVPRVLRNLKRSLLLAPAGLAVGLALVLVTSGTVRRGGVNMAFHDGVAHSLQGDQALAEILLLKAFEVACERTDGIDLNGVDALYNLGIISIRKGDVESAKAYWEAALTRNPGYFPAYQALRGLTL